MPSQLEVAVDVDGADGLLADQQSSVAVHPTEARVRETVHAKARIRFGPETRAVQVHLVPDGEQVLVGALEAYEARCRGCHSPRAEATTRDLFGDAK